MISILKNPFLSFLNMIISANMVLSCHGSSEIENPSQDQGIQFGLNGISLDQVQLLSPVELIGISYGGNAVVLSADQDRNNLITTLNSKGKVISLQRASDDLLLALLIPHEREDTLALVKISLENGALLEEIEISLRKSASIFDGIRINEQERTIKLIYNVEYLDAQIIAFDDGYTAIIFRKNIVPTVLWVKANEPTIEQPLFPVPINDFDAQLSISYISFKAWKRESELMIALEIDPSILLPLKSFFPLEDAEFHDNSHFIIASTPSSLSLARFSNLGHGAILVDNNNGKILSASIEAGFLVIRNDLGDIEFTSPMPEEFHSKTSIRDLYVDDSGIWLVGETGLNQVKTGSIVSGSEAFLVRIHHEDSIVNVKKWHFFKQRRNLASHIFEFQGEKILLLIEDAPLTHDSDRQANLSLLRMDKIAF